MITLLILKTIVSLENYKLYGLKYNDSHTLMQQIFVDFFKLMPKHYFHDLKIDTNTHF